MQIGDNEPWACSKCSSGVNTFPVGFRPNKTRVVNLLNIGTARNEDEWHHNTRKRQLLRFSFCGAYRGSWYGWIGKTYATPPTSSSRYPETFCAYSKSLSKIRKLKQRYDRVTHIVLPIVSQLATAHRVVLSHPVNIGTNIWHNW